MQLLYLWIRTLQVAEENNMPVDKFCFVMAKSFINDVDANKYKVENTLQKLYKCAIIQVCYLPYY